ncbi:MAG: NAD(P)-dependent oxidoreductase [Bradyrhizobiaceae bacterium]|nr:NAD(P)-dependent oxidoreductase [Bradyrhizobiaceae bacterium]
MKVGFIGLGRMGTAMAQRLLQAGHEVAVFNRTPAKAKPLADAGAKVVPSISEAAAFGEAVFTMLTDDAAVDDVARQKGGLLDALPKGGIHICSGTHGVGVIRALTAAHQERGQILVAAPILGRPEQVLAGVVGVVAGGPAEAIQRCTPLFAAIGRRTFEAGAEPAAATSLKLANNFVLGCAIEAMGEGFALIRKYGVAPEVFYDVMTDGLFAAPAYKVYGKIIVEESYDKAGQTAINGLKDAKLALAAGGTMNVPLPSGQVWHDRLAAAVARGEGEKDWAVMALEQARESGLA